MSAIENLSDEAQSLARVPLFQRLEPHELEHLAEDVEQVNYKAGEVISGDPKRIKEVTDIWTFAREVASRNPNWRLIATQAAN